MRLESKSFASVIGSGLVLPDPEPAPFPVPVNLGRPCMAYACEKQPAAGIVPAGALRRLGRAQQMAIAASHRALGAAALDETARGRVAVCVGTGLGELGNTYAFLENMIRNNEQQPKPAAFINSVHNAIAGQLAILLGCKGENHTFLNESCSFESALWQGIHLIRRGRAQHVLVCGVDELNGYMIGAERGLGIIRSTDAPISPLAVDDQAESGTLPGEGAAAFVLAAEEAADRRHPTIATWSRPIPHKLAMENPFPSILESIGQTENGIEDIDFVIFNADGDATHDAHYTLARHAIDTHRGRPVAFGVFKHRIGDFHASSAIGAELGVEIIRSGASTDAVRWFSVPPPHPPRVGLVYNITRSGLCGLSLIRA